MPHVPPTEVRIGGADRKNAPIIHGAKADVSAVVATICGDDPATADRCEARNGALGSITRRRNFWRVYTDSKS